MALTRKELDRMQCGTPGCEEEHSVLFFHAACHPGAGTWARYEAGEVTVECARCRQVVAVIAVADGTG